MAPWVGKGIWNQKQARGVQWRWDHLGFQTEVSDRFVMVRGDGWRIADYGDRCLLDTVTPEAVEALIAKARRDWNGTVQCHGSQHFLEQAWLEAQRQGVEFSVRDDPSWQPPAHIVEQWGLEQREQMEAQQAQEAEEMAWRARRREPEVEAPRFVM